MLRTLDISTLSVCSMLSSAAFGVVFLVLWQRRRSERHLLYWSLSSWLYAFIILAFQQPIARMPAVSIFLFAALGLSDVLLPAGVYRLDGEPPFRPWMIAAVLAAALSDVVSTLLPATEAMVGDVWRACGLSVAIGASGIAILREDDRFAGSRGRKLAGWALLAYLPGYLIAVIGRLWCRSTIDLLAMIPTLLDQVLLGVLNLGLLAIPTERAHQRLREAASKDYLTGAWNRAGLAHEGPKLTRRGGALIAIDIDHFKAINDRYGHTAGDGVLIAFARIVGDLAAERQGKLFRVGGDEFVAILPECPIDQALTTAAEIKARLTAAEGAPATVSLGVAVTEDQKAGLDAALEAADAALYRAKSGGRDRISI